MNAIRFAVVALLFILAAPIFADPLASVSQPAVSVKPNLNQVDANTLTQLKVKGLGQKRAEAIIQYREKNGPFHSFEDLVNVKGISALFIKSHLAQLQELLSIS